MNSNSRGGWYVVPTSELQAAAGCCGMPHGVGLTGPSFVGGGQAGSKVAWGEAPRVQAACRGRHKNASLAGD